MIGSKERETTRKWSQTAKEREKIGSKDLEKSRIYDREQTARKELEMIGSKQRKMIGKWSQMANEQEKSRK